MDTMNPCCTAGLVRGENVSLAWLAALEYLLACGGKTVNLMVAIERPTEEDPGIRVLLDAFVAQRRGSGMPKVRTVANTIFPSGLYFPRLGEHAREHLYENHRFGQPIARMHRANRNGTYFDRLVAWPDPKGPVNQLERTVLRLRQQLERPGPMSSAYELGISTVEDFARHRGKQGVVGDAELRIYQPGRDNSTRGFPCLSHISLTLFVGRLHMTAVYRNQGFLRRAYGNSLGLASFLDFLCREVGCAPGELVCVATHADLEIGSGAGCGKGSIATLARDCRRAVEERDRPSEVTGSIEPLRAAGSALAR